MPGDELVARIQALSDDAALRVLTRVAEDSGFAVDASSAEVANERVREALSQPDVESVVASPGEQTSPGELARLALVNLATADERVAQTVEGALDDPASFERIEPVTMAIAALVLFAFRADIKLEKEPDKGWRFHFHTKPMSDSTIGTVLGKLFGLLH
jgi:hypothetical protein